MKIYYHPEREKYYHMKKPDHCELCTQTELDIYETENMKLIANKFPYTSGHCMIIPKTHKITFESLTEDELKEKDEIIKLATKAFKKAFDTDSFNFGYHEGQYAGGSLSHFHIHIIPRFDSRESYLKLFDTTITAISPKDCVKHMKEALK